MSNIYTTLRRMSVIGVALLSFATLPACGGDKDEFSEEEIEEFLDAVGATGGSDYYYDDEYDYYEDEGFLTTDGEEQ